MSLSGTPRGRQLPRRSTPRAGSVNTPPTYYMPRQSLFDRDQAFSMVHADNEEMYETVDRHNAQPFYGRARTTSRTNDVSPLSELSTNSSTRSLAPLTPTEDQGSIDWEDVQHSQPDMVHLFQEQQALLKKVIAQQETMQKQQEQYMENQRKLQEKIDDLEEKVSENSCKQKVRIPRQLTNLVTTVHDELEESFKPDESSVSSHNKRIKADIIKNIASSDKYTTDQIKCAVKRKYEFLRRQWVMDNKENSAEIFEAQIKHNKYRARRNRKFTNRAQVVKPSEMQWWQHITPDYLTEESDNSSDETVMIEHKMPWRSRRLNEFMIELDKRYDSKVRKEGGAVMAKKVRKLGHESSSKPPDDAPLWAINATGNRSEDSAPVPGV